MALFSRKTKKDDVKVSDTAPVAVAAPKVAGTRSDVSHVLHSPRITEKASMHMEHSAYVFDVAQSANKKQIKDAVFAIYKVKPAKVAIVNIKSKTVRNMRTGKSGVKGGGKKAYVYLQKGATITIS